MTDIRVYSETSQQTLYSLLGGVLHTEGYCKLPYFYSIWHFYRVSSKKLHGALFSWSLIWHISS